MPSVGLSFAPTCRDVSSGSLAIDSSKFVLASKSCLHARRRPRLPPVSASPSARTVSGVGLCAAFIWLCAQYTTDALSLQQSKTVSVSHARIFVAELPTKYNSQLVQALETFQPDDPGDITTLLKNPLGDLLNPESHDGLRQHYYYSLEVWLHQQLLGSALRVQKLQNADVIFLPLYLGVAQKLIIHFQHQQTARLLENFWEEYSNTSTFRSKIPHWVALADIELLYQAGCGGWGTNFLCSKEQKLPAALVISSPEVFLGSDPNRALDFTHTFKRSDWEARAVAVPYMGHVHLSRAVVALSQTFGAKEVEAAKQFLAVQSFTNKTTFRQKLIADCTARHPECQHIGPSTETRTSFDQRRIQQITEQSWFCIQPAGDTPTRAATFDCLMAGSIPVYFDPLMIDLLPFGDKIAWREIVLILPESDSGGPTALDILAGIQPASRLNRLRQLHDVRATLQYSIHPDHRQVHFSALDMLANQDDAFTSTIKAILQNLCRRHVLQPRCQMRQKRLRIPPHLSHSKAEEPSLQRDIIADDKRPQETI